MNIKEILADIVPKADISEENRKTLTAWLEQFEKTPDENELVRTIEKLQSERDSAQKSLRDMIFKNHVAELAETYFFSDKGYLEYLCKINNIDFADSECPKKFMAELQTEAPKFFKLNLQSGTGGNSGTGEVHAAKKDYQSNDILTLLNNAPEFRG